MSVHSRIQELIHQTDPFVGFDANEFDFDPSGWGSDSPVFGELIRQYRPELILEVGVWMGASTMTMAKAAREVGVDSAILSIDTWLGAREFWVEHDDPTRYQALNLSNGFPRVYYQFLANMVHAGISDIVVPFPQTSLIAGRFLKAAGIKADMIYVDASHDADDVFMDLLTYAPLLKPSGVLFGDDYDQHWPGVRQAVDLFAAMHGANVRIADDRYWIIEKPGHLLTRPLIDIVSAANRELTYPHASRQAYPLRNPSNGKETDMPTPNIDLPYIEPSQAQKYVTHNEALQIVDALVQLAVERDDLLVAPTSPEDGERHIVAGNATGAWSGRDGQVAAYIDNAWQFHVPDSGWTAFVRHTGRYKRFDGADWRDAIDEAVSKVTMVGINATPTLIDRLTVASASTLFNHEGDDHRLKINRAETADTASVIFQTSFAGSAETGLIGSEEYEIKVTANGMDWISALRANPSNGHVTLPNGLTSENWAIAPQFCVTGPTGSFRGYALQSAGIFRFDIGVDNGGEIGGNVGSDLYVNRFADDGAYLGTAIRVSRASGVVELNGGVAQSSANLAAPTFLVAELPDAASRGVGALIFVTDATGGPTLAYSDGAAWLRVADASEID